MTQEGRATVKARLAVLLIAVLPLALAIAAACRGGGSDDELTLEEYFEQLDAALESSDIELGRLQTDYLGNPEGSQTWIKVAAFQDFCTGVVQHYRRVVADLESMDPPPLVKGAHEQFIATQVEALDFFVAINDRAWRVSTVDEFVDVLRDARGFTWREIEGRGSEWCFSLEQIGVRFGVEVSLECFR